MRRERWKARLLASELLGAVADALGNGNAAPTGGARWVPPQQLLAEMGVRL
jgi:hypothetical protein